MSLVILEVKIDHGRVVSRGPEPLPEKARGLITLFPESDGKPPSPMTMGEFLDKWAGAFSLPSPAEIAADPRLADLIAKHVK